MAFQPRVASTPRTKVRYASWDKMNERYFVRNRGAPYWYWRGPHCWVDGTGKPIGSPEFHETEIRDPDERVIKPADHHAAFWAKQSIGGRNGR